MPGGRFTRMSRYGERMGRPFSSPINPLGAPWRLDDRGYVYQSSDDLIGTILHGNFQTPHAIFQWISGAAEVANVLYPFSLESTYHIKDIGRSLVGLTNALRTAMDGGHDIISQVCEGRFSPPDWWQHCQEYTRLAGTQVSYDDPRFIGEDWKHRVGWSQHVAPAIKSVQASGLLNDFKALTKEATGHWDGTSALCAGDQILFKTDARALDKECPQAMPLFGKLLRRTLKQGRADNPLAPPDLLHVMAEAIMAVKVNMREIEAMLNTQTRSTGTGHALVMQANKKLQKLKSEMKAAAQNGTRIETVLAMTPEDRSEYYAGIRRRDLKVAQQEGLFGVNFLTARL